MCRRGWGFGVHTLLDMELPALLAANEDYRRTFGTAERPAPPARRLVILTCMDARLDPSGALGLALGDAHVLRNAGGRASPDAIRSLVLSTHVLGTREVGVIHHTLCGLEGLTDADAEARTGVSGMQFLGFGDLVDSVREDLGIVRDCGLLPPETVSWGAIYDVDTGALQVVDDGSPD